METDISFENLDSAHEFAKNNLEVAGFAENQQLTYLIAYSLEIARFDDNEKNRETIKKYLLDMAADPKSAVPAVTALKTIYNEIEGYHVGGSYKTEALIVLSRAYEKLEQSKLTPSAHAQIAAATGARAVTAPVLKSAHPK